MATDPPSSDVWTVGRILDWTTEHLKAHGSESPRLEAEILLAHARGCPRIQLYVHYSEPVTEAQRAVMRELVKRRSQSEPVAYLVGRREFFGLEFRVTRDVLVPRPETETLVLELLGHFRKRQAESTAGEARRILDVGTGSGCIAVATAVNLATAAVTATDVSAKALAVARENALKHEVADRVRFEERDLLAGLAESDLFDAIASNPPYVANAEMDQLPTDVHLHEPHLALRAGPQGLDVIARLIEQAPEHLAPGGLLLLEISSEQAPAVTDLIAARPSLTAARVVKDAAGKPRVIAAQKR
ncbi:MAG: peptide chain release factor N(5)-glutamine methyltransferase [Planctomycetaceae bacterium]